jgi:LPXTG-motif cell wall-anchored protein
MLLYVTGPDWLIYAGLAITALAFLLMYRRTGAASER